MSQEVSIVEFAKVNAAIELKNLEIAYLNGGLPGGVEEFNQVREVLETFIKADLTEDDILAAARGDLGAMDGLFKKIGRAIKKVSGGVQKTVNKIVPNVVKKAVGAVVKVTTTPARLLVKAATAAPKAVASLGITVALKALKGMASRAFLYSFIPDNSPYLDANPKVKAKKQKADKVIKVLAEMTFYDEGGIRKHIRNSIIDHYKKTPEAQLKEISGGYAFNDTFNGMGAAGTAVAIISALAPIAVALVAAKFGKDDIPETGDWNKPVPDDVNITGEPLFDVNGNLVTLEDVKAGAEKATNAAGKVAAWLGVATGIFSIGKAFTN